MTATHASEALRYSRQMLLPGVGSEGQARLSASTVLIVGVGGLGVPAATYLAAAGVGTLRLIDPDRVDPSNLHRQPLYTDADVGRLKVHAAGERLGQINPEVRIVPHTVHLTAENALDLVQGCDVVIDGTDTFATRYAVNDACVRAAIPNVYASVNQFDGQAAVFGGALGGQRGPCYRCLFPEPPPAGLIPSCAEGGVLGVLPGLLGTLQATETLKLLLGIGRPLVGRLLLADALEMSFRTLRVDRDPACAVCGDRPAPPAALSHQFSPMPAPSVPEITVTDVHAMIERGERPFILDVREPHEYAAANIDGALIPIGDLPDRLSELDSHRTDPVLVVHCRSGSRSARAVELLRAHGFENAVNMKGGIRAWSDEIDPSVPKI